MTYATVSIGAAGTVVLWNLGEFFGLDWHVGAAKFSISFHLFCFLLFPPLGLQMKLYLYKFENFFLPQLQLSSMSKLFMVYCKYAHKKNLPCAPPNPTNTPRLPSSIQAYGQNLYLLSQCLSMILKFLQSKSFKCLYRECVFLDNKQILKENEIKSFFKLVGFHCSLLLMG